MALAEAAAAALQKGCHRVRLGKNRQSEQAKRLLAIEETGLPSVFQSGRRAERDGSTGRRS
jgi:hypothetical protein